MVGALGTTSKSEATTTTSRERGETRGGLAREPSVGPSVRSSVRRSSSSSSDSDSDSDSSSIDPFVGRSVDVSTTGLDFESNLSVREGARAREGVVSAYRGVREAWTRVCVDAGFRRRRRAEA